MSPVRGDVHFAHLATTDENEERMCEFMTGDVKPHHETISAAEKEDQPENTSDSKSKELGGAPIVTGEGVGPEEDEKRFDEHPAKGQKKDPEKKFEGSDHVFLGQREG